MKQKSMLFYERVKKSNSTLASTSGFSFTCPKSRTKIIPKTSLLKNMKTLQTMTEQGRRERVDRGEGGERSANASAETLITKRKMSKFFCGLRGSLNVRGNKCNCFSLSFSLSSPISLSFAHLLFFLGTFAREFSTRVFSLYSCVALMFFWSRFKFWALLSSFCFIFFFFSCVYYQSILFWCLCRGLHKPPAGQRARQRGKEHTVAVVGTGNVNESFAYECLCNLAWNCN